MVFSVSHRPPAERLTSFRLLTHTLYDAWPRGGLESFDVASTGFRVGSLVFSEVRFSPLHFRRGPEHLRAKEQDFLVLEAMLDGEQRLAMEAGYSRMRAGHIYLRDWAHGFDAEGETMRLRSVLIPRRRLKAGEWMHAGSPVISWSMKDPVGRLMFALWSGLLAEFEHAHLPAAENAVDAFLGFIDALLGHTTAEPAPVTLGAMQQFLLARLQCDVGTNDLCAHFNVSRTKVYRFFEPHGGVRRYLTRARMDRCYAELYRADPKRHTVGDIAGSWGFFEASSFSRGFKRQFGTAPSAVLGAGFRKHVAASPEDLSLSASQPFGDYIRWYWEATGLAYDASEGLP